MAILAPPTKTHLRTPEPARGEMAGSERHLIDRVAIGSTCLLAVQDRLGKQLRPRRCQAGAAWQVYLTAACAAVSNYFTTHTTTEAATSTRCFAHNLTYWPPNRPVQK